MDGNAFKLMGSIFPPAEKTWGLAHDGTHLYVQARTHEIRRDAKIFIVGTYLENYKPPPFLGSDPGRLIRKKVSPAEIPEVGRPILPKVREYGLQRAELMSTAGTYEAGTISNVPSPVGYEISDIQVEQLSVADQDHDYATQWESLTAFQEQEYEGNDPFSSGADLGTTMESFTPVISEYEEEMGDGTEIISSYQSDPESTTPEAVSEISAMSVTEDDRSSALSEIMSD